MNQTTINFDAPIPPITCEPRDTKRLTGQNGKILERLRLGPATLDEICEVSGSRKHTSRISDIRKHLRPQGYEIHCQQVPGGNSIYTLIEKQQP